VACCQRGAPVPCERAVRPPARRRSPACTAPGSTTQKRPDLRDNNRSDRAEAVKPKRSGGAGPPERLDAGDRECR
jgi:hypothetical protein